MIKILIVEDEMIIAQDMINMLEKMGYDVLDNAMDAIETFEILANHTPDLILLDINLSGKRDGIDIAREINEKYKIPFIFTTSHTDGPTIERAKEVNPINYLVKPFKPEQLYTAIEIAMHNLELKENPRSQPAAEDTQSEEGLVIKGALFIKEKFKFKKVLLQDILWIKAEGNYLELFTNYGKFLIRATLNNFMCKLDPKTFFKTNKSYVVNLDHLTQFDQGTVTIDKTEIPISKTNAEELMKRMDIV